MSRLRTLDDVAAAARREWCEASVVERWLGVGIFAFAIAVRLAVLDQPMRYDETWMYLTHASQSFATVIGDYSFPNNHVFHTLLVWLSTRALGNAPWVIRLPTLMAGTLIVPATYFVARRLATPRAGLFAAALAAGLPILILYATNARGYVIICLASLLLLLVGDWLLTNDAPAWWIAFAIIVAIGAFTVPIMLYSAGGVGLWMLAEKARRDGVRSIPRFAGRLIAAMALAGLLTLAAYGLIIARSGIAPLVSNRFVTPLAWDQFVQSLPDFVRSLRDVLGLGIPRALALLLAAAVVASLVVKGPHRASRVALVVSIGVWSVVVLVATRRPPPPRVWLFTVPFACVFAGAGLAEIAAILSRGSVARARVLAAAGVLLLTAALGVQTLQRHVVIDSEETDYYGLREAPDIARFLLPQLHPGDHVVAARTTGLPLDYYLLQLGGKRLAEFDSGLLRGRVFVIVNERHGQTIANLRDRRSDVPWNDVPALVSLRKFEGATVYQSP
jgi:hypothetical protein